MNTPVEIRVAAVLIAWALVTIAFLAAPALDVVIAGALAAVLVLLGFALIGTNGRRS